VELEDKKDNNQANSSDTKTITLPCNKLDCKDDYKQQQLTTVLVTQETSGSEILVSIGECTKTEEAPKVNSTICVVNSQIPAYAGLPLDDTCGAWMDEDIVIIDSSEDEMDVILKPATHEIMPGTISICDKDICSGNNQNNDEFPAFNKDSTTQFSEDMAKPSIDSLSPDNTYGSSMDERVTFVKGTDKKGEKFPESSQVCNRNLSSDSSEDARKENERTGFTMEKVGTPVAPMTDSNSVHSCGSVLENNTVISILTQTGYAGLPLDNTSGSWMDESGFSIENRDDEKEQMLSPEEGTEPQKSEKLISGMLHAPLEVSHNLEKVDDMSKISKVHNEKPVQSGYAGLPLDDTCGSWMDDSGLIIEDSDNEEEQISALEIVPALQNSEKLTSEEMQTQIEVSCEHEVVESLSESSKPTAPIPTEKPVQSGYAGLPLDDTCGSRMDDNGLTIQDSDTEEQVENVSDQQKYENVNAEEGVYTTDRAANEVKLIENLAESSKNAVPIPTEKPVQLGYAGLPLDGTCGSWMDDSGFTIEDSDNEEEQITAPEKVSELPNKDKFISEEGHTTMETPLELANAEKFQEKSKSTTLVPTEKPLQSGYAGLPLDDTSGSWMDDNVLTIQESDTEEEHIENVAELQKSKNLNSEAIVREANEIKVGENFIEISVSNPNEKLLQSGFAGLPLDDASGSWMDDSRLTIEDSDNEDKHISASEIVPELQNSEKLTSEEMQIPVEAPFELDVVENLSESSETTAPIPFEKPVQLGYAGLPLDDTCGSWMDDSGFTIEDSDNEEEKKLETQVLFAPPNSNLLPSDIKGTRIDVHPTGQKNMAPSEASANLLLVGNFDKTMPLPYAGLPMDESCGTWMDESIIPMNDSDLDEEEMKVEVSNSALKNAGKISGENLESTEMQDRLPADQNETTALETQSVEYLVEPIASHAQEKYENPVNPDYAGLPLDNASGSWMEDVTFESSDDDDDEPTENEINSNEHISSGSLILCETPLLSKISSNCNSDERNIEHSALNTGISDENYKNVIIKETKSDEGSVKPIKNPSKNAYAGLPMDTTCDSWMDEDIVLLSESDSEIEEKEKLNIIPRKEIISKGSTTSSLNLPNRNAECGTQKNQDAFSIIGQNSLSTVYAGLPIDDSCGLWMDDSIIPMSDSDEELEQSVDQKKQTLTAISEEAGNDIQVIDVREFSKAAHSDYFPEFAASPEAHPDVKSNTSYISFAAHQVIQPPNLKASSVAHHVMQVQSDEVSSLLYQQHQEISDGSVSSLSHQASWSCGTTASHKTVQSYQTSVTSLSHQVPSACDISISAVSHQVRQSSKLLASSVSHQVSQPVETISSLVAHQVNLPSQASASALSHRVLQPTSYESIASTKENENFMSFVSHEVLHRSEAAVSLVAHQMIKPVESVFSSVAHQVVQCPEEASSPELEVIHAPDNSVLTTAIHCVDNDNMEEQFEDEVSAVIEQVNNPGGLSDETSKLNVTPNLKELSIKSIVKKSPEICLDDAPENRIYDTPSKKKSVAFQLEKDYAGLPLDDSCGSWMDDGILTMEDSDDEANGYAVESDNNVSLMTSEIVQEIPYVQEDASVKCWSSVVASNNIKKNEDKEDRVKAAVEVCRPVVVYEAEHSHIKSAEVDSEGFKKVGKCGKGTDHSVGFDHPSELSERMGEELKFEDNTPTKIDIPDIQSVELISVKVDGDTEEVSIKDKDVPVEVSIKEIADPLSISSSNVSDENTESVENEEIDAISKQPCWSLVVAKSVQNQELHNEGLKNPNALAALSERAYLVNKPVVVFEINPVHENNQEGVDGEGFLVVKPKRKAKRSNSFRSSLTLEEMGNVPESYDSMGEGSETSMVTVINDEIKTQFSNKSLASNLAQDSFWTEKPSYDNAEEKYIAASCKLNESKQPNKDVIFPVISSVKSSELLSSNGALVLETETNLQQLAGECLSKAHPKLNTSSTSDSPTKLNDREESVAVTTLNENSSINQCNVQITQNCAARMDLLAPNYSKDSFWLDKHIFDDAEAKYFRHKKLLIPQHIADSRKTEDHDDGDGGNKESTTPSVDSKSQNVSTNEGRQANAHPATKEIYGWSDESTYLSPSIPVLEPKLLKVEKPSDLMEYGGICEGELARAFQV
jgi:hypothetical protein